MARDQTLVVRADANARIGAGHVMRCLALAQAWQDDGGRAIFLMAPNAPSLEKRLKSEATEVIRVAIQPGSADDATQTAHLARQMGALWVVVDGYHFDADYQRIIKDAGLRLLFVDDHGHSARYYADIVLNQNLHAHRGLYANREPYTRLLLGTRYVLLRREFLNWRGWKRRIAEVAHNVLVTMGGSDPYNVTLKVIQALQRLKLSDIEIKVALESNKPKGHLIKPGAHLTLRYVLVDDGGIYVRGKKTRGKVPWIWEVRVGTLTDAHFNFSNTEGDSGQCVSRSFRSILELAPLNGLLAGHG